MLTPFQKVLKLDRAGIRNQSSRRKPPTCYHKMLYQVHLAMTGIIISFVLQNTVHVGHLKSLHSLHRTQIKINPDFDTSDRERIIL